MNSTHWIRGKATVKGSWLFMHPSDAEVYEVNSERRATLVRDFYKLCAYATGSDAGKKHILHFINNFGFLRQGVPEWRRLKDSNEPIRENLEDWHRDLNLFAKIMKIAILQQQIAFGTTKQQSHAMQLLREIYNEWGEQLDASDKEVSWAMGQVVCDYVSRLANDTRLSVKMVNSLPPSFQYEVVCPHLMGLIAVGISEMITTSPVSKLPCLHCGQAFEVRDRRMKYCSERCRSRATSQRNYSKKIHSKSL